MTTTQVVIPSDLGVDFDVGGIISNKISVVRATSSTPGLVTLAQIVSLSQGANNSAATTATLGVVKIGAGILVDSYGVISLDAANVELTGGTIDGVAIGSTHAAAGSFTSITSSGNANLTSITAGSTTVSNLVVSATSTLTSLTVSGATNLQGNVILGTSNIQTLTVNSTVALNSQVSYSQNIVTTATGAIQVPVGPTSARPSSPLEGMIRKNQTTGAFEGYDGTTWTSIGGTATGGGPDQVFYLNGQACTASYTLPSGKNAVTAGPVTINAAATITIPTGAGWSVV